MEDGEEQVPHNLRATFDLSAQPSDGPRIYSYTQIAGIRPGYFYRSNDGQHEVPEVKYQATWITFKGLEAPESELSGTGPIAIMFGAVDPTGEKVPLVRVHSGCMTGDTFGAFTCDCGPQLTEAIQIMNERDAGSTIIYLPHHEGRGIGIANKIEAYALAKAEELDTYEAMTRLDHEPDQRDYKAAAQMLALIGVKRFDLLSGNPKKIAGLMEHAAEHGLDIRYTVPTKLYLTDENREYLTGKEAEGAHQFSDGSVNGDGSQPAAEPVEP